MALFLFTAGKEMFGDIKDIPYYIRTKNRFYYTFIGP